MRPRRRRRLELVTAPARRTARSSSDARQSSPGCRSGSTAALAGAGGVVFVTGERGAGKSALVGEMLRRVRGSRLPITIVAGRCLEHQGPRDPLQPFLDALGRLFGTSRGREQAVELVKTWAPDDRRADAGRARAGPGRIAPPTDGGRDPRAPDPRGGRLHRCRHTALPRRAGARGPAVGGPGERRGALSPRASRRSPAHPDPLHLPPFRGRGVEPAASPRHARPAHGRPRPRARARPARRARRRAVARAALPRQRLRSRARSPAPRARRRPAALRAQPVRAARWRGATSSRGRGDSSSRGRPRRSTSSRRRT